VELTLAPGLLFFFNFPTTLLCSFKLPTTLLCSFKLPTTLLFSFKNLAPILFGTTKSKLVRHSLALQVFSSLHSALFGQETLPGDINDTRTA
jgi:hypothetical protein